MHWVKGVVGVNKNTTTQHYSMHSAKVMWGLWVFGLHEEAHQPRARDDLSGPLPFGEKKSITVDLPSDNHVRLFLHVV